MFETLFVKASSLVESMQTVFEYVAVTRDTRTLLLDAAEQVLLDDGLAGASLRRITAVAGVNVAAVNYTFGSKEALLEALLTRVLEPVLAERARRLDEVAGTPGHTVNDLVRALLESMLRVDQRHVALYAEVSVKPRLGGDQRFDETRRSSVQTGIDRVTAALAPLLPGQPPEVLGYRVERLLKMATIHVLDGMQLAQKYGVDPGADGQDLIDDLVAFFSAGLAAPTPLTLRPASVP